MDWPPNPFLYDRPLEPAELIDREQELRLLVSMAEAGQTVRLSAPRRFGKTTLLRRALVEVEKRGSATVYVDLYGAVSVAQVADRIEQAYRRQLQGPVGRSVANVLRTMRPRVRVGAPGVASAEVRPGPEADARRLLERMLDLPLDVFKRTGRRTLVVFDEFQEVLRAGTEVEALVRSRVQHQGREASYVFAGSHPGLMLALFADRERPFYGQARPLALEPLEDGPLADYVESRFERSGRGAGEALDPLLDLVRGHPQRAMLLAHHLWERTPPGGRADLDAWAGALDAAVLELREGFERTWERLTTNQARVLAALAGSADSLFHRRTLAAYGLTKGGAEHGRDGLIEFGDVRQAPDGPEIVDPLLELWVREYRRSRR